MLSRSLATFLGIALVAASVVGQEWVPIGGVRFQGNNAVYDTARDRVLVFAPDACLWEVDGDAALLRGRPGTGAWPGPRMQAALAFDSRRRELILFGGWNGRNTFGDTWIWDGESWRQPFSLLPPPRRSGSSMVYDPVRDRTVLFGGGNLADTWEWDGTQWSERTPATALTVHGSSLSYWDSTRNRVVLVLSEIFATRVYHWDGVDWHLQPLTGTPPPILVSTQSAYDPVRDRFVAIGGATFAATPGGIHEWDGASWRSLGTFPAAARAGGSCWFDSSRSLVTFAGGKNGLFLQHDVWTWDGSRLRQVEAPSAPPDLEVPVWFWDRKHDVCRLYGGFVGMPYNGAIWSWDGQRWTAAAVDPGSPVLGSAAAATDLGSGRGLVFGGFNDNAEFWACDDGVWLRLPGGPPGRRLGSLAVDESRATAVLFGGYNAGTPLGDTWEFANGSWTRRAPLVSPPARWGAAMAFDASRARIVMFGGAVPVFTWQQWLADTWEWDGVQWIRVTTATTPPTAIAPSMAFDPATNTTILTAYVEPGGIGRDETWSYDGVDWTLEAISAATVPSQLALDTRRGRIVAIDSRGNLRERTPSPATTAALGAGCGALAPRLAARTVPRVGEFEFGLEAEVANSGQPVLFAVATAATPTPGTGCGLWIGAPAGVALQLANGNGLAVQRIPLPMQPALRGLRVFARAATLDPAQGPLLTRGLAITCGD